MKTIGERILFARLHPKTGEKKITLQKIATEIGHTPQLIKKWQLNESEPKARDLLVVERLTGFSAKWLLTGVEDSPDGGTLDILQRGGRPVAQIDLNEVGDYLGNADFVVKTRVMSFHQGGPRSFEVVIKDRSNDPVMIPGDRVMIDPDRQPDPEDFCLALYEGRYVVRRYLDRLDSVELEPANKAFATVRVSKDDIVGRVIEFTRKV